MKTVCKKLLSLMLVAVLLVSVVPFQAFAAVNASNILVDVYVNNEYKSTKYFGVNENENKILDEEFAMSLLRDKENRTFVKWVSSSGKEFQEAELDYNWLMTQDSYKLSLYFNETTPEPTETEPKETEPAPTETEPAPTETEAQKVYYNVKISANVNNNYNTSASYEEGTKLTLNAELVGLTAFAKNAEVYWKVNGTEVEKDTEVTVNSNLDIVCSVTTPGTQNIYLNANGGYLTQYDSYYYSIVVGQPYGSLPTPIREDYTFAYWYYMNGNTEVRVKADTAAVNATLYAKWVKNGYYVHLQRYDANAGWTTVETHTVPANSTLTVKDGTFPSSNTKYALDGFEIIGWEINETDTAFYAGSTQISYNNMIIRPRYKGTVTLKAQNGNDGSWTWKEHSVEIGEPLGSMPSPGNRDGKAFDSWTYGESISVSSNDLYDYITMGDTFYAKWVDSFFIHFYIHTNGNTTTATKIIPYYGAPAKGEFNIASLNWYALYSDYGKYDDANDTHHGWYTEDQWGNYCKGAAANNAHIYYNIEANGYDQFHMMFFDGGGSTSSNYNNNSSTADKTNPTTGDQIFMAVTVMAMSASALALFFFLKKRKAC